MSEYYAKVKWVRKDDEIFKDNKYSRGHVWIFDGGITVPASASPNVVPIPYSVEANVDPEEAFVASLSSCHMLFFLSIAAKKKYVIDEYTDNAIGTMEKDSKGRFFMSKVTLRPIISSIGQNQPTPAQIEKIHHQAHEQCYISNSVKTEVIIEM